MRLVLSTIAAVATLLVAVKADQAPLDVEPALQAQGAPGAAWSYSTGNTGPSHWANLDASFEACEKGTRQSPIDINSETLNSFVDCVKRPLVFDYERILDASVHWDGHLIDLKWKDDGKQHRNSIVSHGKRYFLEDVQFHTPSEHRIQNRHSEAELQLVHRASDDSVLVVAVLLHAQYVNLRFFDWATGMQKLVKETFADRGIDVANGLKTAAPLVRAPLVRAPSKGKPDDDEDGSANLKEDGNGAAADFESQEIDENEDEENLEDEDSNMGEDVDQAQAVNDPERNAAAQFESLAERQVECDPVLPISLDSTVLQVKIPSLDFSSLLASLDKFTPRWEYEGSLSQPPCTENVRWALMEKSVPIGIEQLKALVDLQGYTARPIRERAA